MDLRGLRERLKRSTPAASSVYGDDGTGREEAALTAASVLVPIVAHADGATVLFTQRTAHLKNHSGQVSFPGGRAEPEDPTAEFTALREAQEEIGIDPQSIEVIARLPDYLTRTGFRITPVVGILTPPLKLTPDAREVDHIFEVPLDFLLDPANHRRQTRELKGQSVGYYVIEHQGRTIWGATAGMLVNFYRQLSDEPPAG